MVGFSTPEIALMREDFNKVNLTMTCIVQRFTATGTDPDGKPTGSWANLHVNLPCWYFEKARRLYTIEEISGPNINVTLSYPHILVPGGVDITTQDKVLSVQGAADDGMLAVNMNIRTVMRRLYNTLLTVEVDR